MYNYRSNTRSHFWISLDHLFKFKYPHQIQLLVVFFSYCMYLLHLEPVFVEIHSFCVFVFVLAFVSLKQNGIILYALFYNLLFLLKIYLGRFFHIIRCGCISF